MCLLPRTDPLKVFLPWRCIASEALNNSTDVKLTRSNQQPKRELDEPEVLKDTADDILAAHKQLAPEQHQLLIYHADFARQRELQKNCYQLVVESITQYTDFANSCSDQIIDAGVKDQLQQRQQQVLNDKVRLLQQMAGVDQAADKLQNEQYRITKQQASLFSRLDGQQYQQSSKVGKSKKRSKRKDRDPSASQLLSSGTNDGADSVLATQMWAFIDEQLKGEQEKTDSIIR